MSVVHSKAPNPEKGARYLVSLDQALCSANWSEVPELARKVDKHAPERTCLTLAARAESHVNTASHRPTSASSATSVSLHSLGDLVPRLVEAITTAKIAHPDDAYIASVCVAEIHWLREAPLEALKALSDVGPAPTNVKSGSGPLGWLEVCAVKAVFIQASCLDSSGRQNESRDCYQAAARQTPGYRSVELRRWTERLLASAAMYSVKTIPSPSLLDFSETYVAFRAWGEFWQRAPAGSIKAGASATRLDIPRRQVWKAHYDLLSAILQHELTYSPEDKTPALIVPSVEVVEAQRDTVKRRQRAELKFVESTYETLILSETQFPKASQTNTEVEEWAEQVMSNWRIFSGSGWTDSDLEQGKRAMSRGVLDILYRAATKTFHSTPILRHLFTVHAARGEFDLALHAFDSYVEIVDKGKARAQKTGRHEIGFDDDDTAMLSAAEAIRVLCRYGDREHGEKALTITVIMQRWLNQPRPSTSQSAQTNGDTEVEDHSAIPTTASVLKPGTLGAAYRAMGISGAHWAQLTYESEKRASLLTEACKNLRQAYQYDPKNVETAHALAFVLAEMRDVTGALEIIRSTFATREQADNENASSLLFMEHQRKMMPLWHLLALCLTAQDEHEAASNMCEAALKQFGDINALFGQRAPLSDNIEKEIPISASNRSLIDQIELCEKETLVQIKMTQMALHELMEGPDEAVDQTDELLSLYSRLFGRPEQVVAEIASKPPQTAVSQAPSRLGGTLRSITGSIRPKSARSTHSSVEKDTIRQGSVVSDDTTLAQSTQFTANGSSLGPPVSITVTNEDGADTTEKHRHRHPHIPHLPFQGRGSRSASIGARTASKSIAENEENGDLSKKTDFDPAKAAVGNVAKPDQPLGDIAHNVPHDQWPPPPGHDDQPPQQDVRLPAPHPASTSSIPDPHLSPIHERRHKVTVLVKAWLFSAELFIRAEIFEDANNLVSDAVKLIETLEIELARSEEGTSARKLFEKGWGNGKSVDALWADVWSTKAHLAAARELPYEAMSAYEQALSYLPDHANAIIGLSTLLLDIYEEKLPAEEPLQTAPPLPTASGSLIKEARPSLTRPNTSSALPSRRPSVIVEPEPIEIKERKIDPAPAELNRLAARDRAYMLLSNLTKQGAGWDDSEAWLTLARAHELSREIGKAKSALWWVVELENYRPIRPWLEAAGPAGFTV